MTDTITEIVDELDRLDRERGVLMDRLRSSLAAPQADVDAFSDLNLLKPGEVVKAYGLSRSMVYRLCVDNEFDGHNDGFAQWNEIEERYRISAPRFAAFHRRLRLGDTS